MNVLNVACPMVPVGPDATGGAEQVVSMLDRALVRAGHGSFVLACEGSFVSGKLIPVPATEGMLGETARERARGHHRRALARALELLPIDLVHAHGIDFERYLPEPGPPLLVTLHLPPGWYAPAALKTSRPRTFFHCVSEAQARTAPASLALLPVIENGVFYEELAAGRAEIPLRRRKFVLCLGRICPEKGYHLACRAAALARFPLLIAGALYRDREHERYYRETLRPLLRPGCRWIGPVALARKRRLLSSARCLLVPSLLAETSSIVAMEALACGTPVVAFPAGALAGIVAHGRTGFLVRSVEEMSKAIHDAADLDPETCRREARERFSAARMTAGYLSLYEQLVGVRGHATPRA
jgi:glycosyltransferase involved in cell wall biosynthesis